MLRVSPILRKGRRGRGPGDKGGKERVWGAPTLAAPRFALINLGTCSSLVWGLIAPSQSNLW